MIQVLYILLYVASIYITIGIYLAVLWVRHDEMDAGTALMAWLFWPAAWDESDKQLMKPRRKTAASKQLKQERKRMALEEAKETTAVLLLEASVQHREKMAALAERRRKAEEIDV